ncbi:MAG: NAD-dependent epimerase/dehydratase family protein [Christensenellales bacterium]|jgi:uronate dehydrogenase
MKKRIFITGGTGRIGSCIAWALRQDGRYDVAVGTRGEGNGSDIVHVDYSSQESLTEALKGVHTVIHMAYYMRGGKFIEEHLDGNVKAAYYLYEAAKINGVKRVIFGSSNHVFGYYEKGEHITSDSLYRPDNNYGLSKCMVELIGRYYSDRYGISCMNIRIGAFGDEPNIPKDDRATYVWLSSGDCAQLFLKAVEYDESCKYLHMFGMSNNEGIYFDTSDNAVIGYEPNDDGALYRGKTAGHQSKYYTLPNDVLTDHKYVGGYSISMDQDGKPDEEYLARLTAEYRDIKMRGENKDG